MALGGGARRPPSSLPPALRSHLTSSSAVGTGFFISQKPARVRDEGAGQARLSRSQPRPQPGFRFHLRLADSGAGRPHPRGPGATPAPAPDHPASHQLGRNPRNTPGDWWKGAATREGPASGTCSEPIPLLAALGPHPLPITSAWRRGRDTGRDEKDWLSERAGMLSPGARGTCSGDWRRGLPVRAPEPRST